MKKNHRKNLYASITMLIAFILWTIAVRLVDVKPIGPDGTSVGFASVNSLIHKLTGVHMPLYHMTDWLGLVPLSVVLGFASLGLIQWVKRKKLSKVDYSLFILGGFYLIVITAYLLFETVPVNYRPVLIDGRLETSYPSSTTLLVMCVMPTATQQLNSRVTNKPVQKCLSLAISIFTAFMVAGRLVSGVHWFTDIVGSILLSAGLVRMYQYFAQRKD